MAATQNLSCVEDAADNMDTETTTALFISSQCNDFAHDPLDVLMSALAKRSRGKGIDVLKISTDSKILESVCVLCVL